MSEGHIFGLIGCLLLLAFTWSLRPRSRRQATAVPDDPVLEEHLRTQQFLEALVMENRRLAAENLALRERLMRDFDDAPAPSPFEAAMQELGLDPRHPVTPRGLRRAYINRVKAVHPDQGGSAEALARVLHAHDFLVGHLARKRPS